MGVLNVWLLLYISHPGLYIKTWKQVYTMQLEENSNLVKLSL